jgi:hypothetical protein
MALEALEMMSAERYDASSVSVLTSMGSTDTQGASWGVVIADNQACDKKCGIEEEASFASAASLWLSLSSSENHSPTRSDLGLEGEFQSCSKTTTMSSTGRTRRRQSAAASTALTAPAAAMTPAAAVAMATASSGSHGPDGCWDNYSEVGMEFDEMDLDVAEILATLASAGSVRL